MGTLCGIYAIRNKVNGKVYIGQAVDIEKRWRNHRNYLKSDKHHSGYLQNAFNKEGLDGFEFMVLEECPRDKNVLQEREQYWMDYYESCKEEKGYNLCPSAGSVLGIKRSVETRRKISEFQKGRVRPPFTEEHRRKLSAAGKGRKHPPRSEETRRKMSEAGKIKTFTEEHRRNISESRKGATFTEEALRKMNEAFKGKFHTEATKLKMSEAARGRPRTVETRRKLSEAARNRSPEHRRKLSEAQKHPQKDMLCYLMREGVPVWMIYESWGIPQNTLYRWRQESINKYQKENIL